MTYHLFISHSWTYSTQYDGLKNLLDVYANGHPSFNYVDYSVPKDDPVHTNGTVRQLEAAIKNHMQPAQVVIVLAGVYASYSKWIDKEIKIAQIGFTNSKPILAIEPYGSERTSATVKEAADKIVGWRTSSIVNAIKELA